MSDTPPSGDDDAADKARSRRNFLKFAGLGAAGIAAAAGAAFGIGRVASTPGGAASGTPIPTPMPSGSLPPRPEGPGFDHLVVLMFENRSFDNLLGWLYADEAPPNGQHFEGLSEELSNTAHDGTVVAAHRYSGPTDVIMSSPTPDPGEEYPHVNTQLFGTVAPKSNRGSRIHEMKAPFNAPEDASTPTMSGFLQDYIDNFVADHDGRSPTPEEYSVVMGSFDPAMLPVFSTLAKNFAVYDHWHCAVPSQTFCNRSFFHAGTSHGYVTNGHHGGYKKWLGKENASPTIFNRLSDAGIDWAVYFDDVTLISLTGFIHAPVLEPYFRTDHFRTMSRFRDDVAQGLLPAYSFIEPRLLYNHNDMHPPVGAMTETDADGNIVDGAAVSDVRAGEALLHEVYSAVRASSSPTGSNAMNTMLLVTFDEHGGTYDHVPPPATVPPEGLGETEMGFTFDRLGVRVPAIAISAYTGKGHIVSDVMHHAAVTRTLTAKYGLDPLPDSTRDVPTLDNAVTLDAPRDPRDWPTTHPAYVPPNPESRGKPYDEGADDRPLSPPGVGLMAMLAAKYASADTKVPKTYREAYELVDRHGKGLFGAPAGTSPSPST
jgi:phospholipase C